MGAVEGAAEVRRVRLGLAFDRQLESVPGVAQLVGGPEVRSAVAELLAPTPGQTVHHLGHGLTGDRSA